VWISDGAPDLLTKILSVCIAAHELIMNQLLVGVPMNRIAFVTTCKSRLHHLQQTLPQWVAEVPDEIVVVDYGCPQGAGDWVREIFPQVTVIRVDDDPGFCLARARNSGAAAVQAEWICFIDADVMVNRGWVEWMRSQLVPGHFYRAGLVFGVRDLETWGSVIVPREAFERIGGYDEVFSGWGGEDTDFYNRLRMIGLTESEYPQRFVKAIAHSDTERFAYSLLKNRTIQLCVNRLYMELKYLSMRVSADGADLPFGRRAELMQRVTTEVTRWQQSGQEMQCITERISNFGDWLPRTAHARSSCLLEVRMEVCRPAGTSLLARLIRRARNTLKYGNFGRDTSDVLHSGLIAPVLAHLQSNSADADSELEIAFDAKGGWLPAPYRMRVHCSFRLADAWAGNGAQVKI
jgi:glycosyltransferase involved in cell wall biosynthesis